MADHMREILQRRRRAARRSGRIRLIEVVAPVHVDEPRHERLDRHGRGLRKHLVPRVKRPRGHRYGDVGQPLKPSRTRKTTARSASSTASVASRTRNRRRGGTETLDASFPRLDPCSTSFSRYTRHGARHHDVGLTKHYGRRRAPAVPQAGATDSSARVARHRGSRRRNLRLPRTERRRQEHDDPPAAWLPASRRPARAACSASTSSATAWPSAAGSATCRAASRSTTRSPENACSTTSPS